MQQIASNNAPSPLVVVPHFIVGGLIWVLVTALIVVFPDSFTQHYFNPQLLAITHLLVLGWITMVIFGALYQLIPVIMEVKLYSEKLAVISLVSLAIGTLLLAISFWNFWLGTTMILAAMFLLVSVSVFSFNVFQSALQSANESIEKQFIQTSIVWLVFTIVAGVTLAFNLTAVFLATPHIELLKLHANAGVVGWFIQLIIGVSSRLVPMFMVSHNLDKSKLKVAHVLINIGLILSVLSIYLQWKLGVVVTAIILLSGIGFFVFFIIDSYKNRIKKQLDIGMKQSVFSFFMLFLGLFIFFFLILTTDLFESLTAQLSIALVSTLLIGFITSLIMGQTYKTLPFIIWLHVYRNRIGKSDIPFPKNLYSELISKTQLVFFALGFLVFFAGILMLNEFIITLGGVLMFISSVLYSFNTIKIIKHKAKLYE